MSVAAVPPLPVRLPVLSPPATRAGCAELPRPCPVVVCRHNLALERLRGRSPVRDDSACSLDYAAGDGMTLQEIADVFGMTRERIRQVQVLGLANLAAKMARRGLISKADAALALAAVRAAFSTNSPV